MDVTSPLVLPCPCFEPGRRDACPQHRGYERAQVVRNLYFARRMAPLFVHQELTPRHDCVRRGCAAWRMTHGPVGADRSHE